MKEFKEKVKWLEIRLLSLVLLTFLCTQLLDLAEVGYDDTDGDQSRSGMALHVDAKTGCEYLSAQFGGITPRLDTSGKHMGCL